MTVGPARDLVPSGVLAAYGVAGSARLLEGGQGSSVRVDGIVLKPGADPVEQAWVAEVTTRVVPDGFRLPQPVTTVDGRLVVDGWSACTWIPGDPVDDDEQAAAPWLAVLEAGRAFHRAVVAEVEPPWLSTRDHRWAVADRSAWAAALERNAPEAVLAVLRRLRALTVEEGLPPQLVHGDLSGNVLLHPLLAPAIIDLSPYWRPVAYADAMVVVDALLWWRADPSLVEAAKPAHLSGRHWTSLLARALSFRLLAEGRPLEALASYDVPVDLLEAR